MLNCLRGSYKECVHVTEPASKVIDVSAVVEHALEYHTSQLCDPLTVACKLACLVLVFQVQVLTCLRVSYQEYVSVSGHALKLLSECAVTQMK